MASLHQGIDLSRFKKIASDGKTSTLRHSKGHEVKIAHTGLSPKMQAHLDGMPLHLAESGDVQKSEDKVPVLSDAAAAPVPAQPVALPPPQVPAAAPQQVIPPKPVPTDAPIPPENTVTVTGERPQKTVAQQAQENVANDLAFQQDMAMGHIKPETYADLYGKKDTLGKIGTLFGLMIGGAGSGLTHQPNALLSMMDKEIERDLQAQKESQSNAQNWHKIGLAHSLNQAQIEQMQTGNIATMTGAVASGIASDIQKEKLKRVGGNTDLSDALVSRLKGMPDPIHDPLTKSKMAIGAVQTLQDKLNKLPPGPTQTMGQQLLDGVVKPGLNKSIIANSAKSAQAKVAKQQSAAQMQSSAQNRGRPYVVDEDKLADAIARGKDDAQLGMAPGKRSIDPNLEKTIQDEKGKLDNHRNIALSANEIWNKLAAMKDAGQIPGAGGFLDSLSGVPAIGGFARALGSMTRETYERERDEMITPLMERLGYNKSDEAKRHQIAAMMPSYTDSQESRKEAHNQLVMHFRDMERDIAPNLVTQARRLEKQGIKGLVNDFPDLPIEEVEKSPGSKDPSKDMKKDGRGKSFRDAVDEWKSALEKDRK